MLSTVLVFIGNLLLFFFVLGLVICIHELGHLYFAKKAGILCYEFAFGMGPKLWSKKKGETEYSIRLFPLGGFVSMAGEEIQSEVVKKGDRIRLVFDEKNIVTHIIMDENDPRYQDALLIEVEDVDLTGTNKNLIINEYNVSREAKYVYKNNAMQIAPYDRRAFTKSGGARFMTMFGGPMMNLILAIFLYLILAFSAGVPDTSSTVISAISGGSPSESILLPGDQITKINGVSVTSWSDDTNSVTSELAKYETNTTFIFTVIRDGSEIELSPIAPIYAFYGLGFAADSKTSDLVIETPIYQKSVLEAGDILLRIDGTSFSTWTEVVEYALTHTEGSTSENPTEVVVLRNNEEVTLKYATYGEEVLNAMGYPVFASRVGITGSNHFSFFGGFVLAGQNFVHDATSIYKTLGLLFTSDQVGVGDLSGFVGIFSMTSNAAKSGIYSLLAWVAFLSVNLGIVNLLPIPALDGGWITFLAIEKITKKRIKPEIQNTIIMITFFLLIGLLIYVNLNDVLKLF